VTNSFHVQEGPALRRFDLDPDTARFFGYSVAEKCGFAFAGQDGDEYKFERDLDLPR